MDKTDEEILDEVNEELLTRKQLTALLKGVRLLLLKEMGFKLNKEEVQKVVVEMGDDELYPADNKPV
jgi:hypothetical protein